MTAYLFTEGKFQGVDNSGVPLNGGLLYTWAAGGIVTPLATYTDQSGGTPNANPVVLDSSGRASVWLGSSSYRMQLKTSTGTLIWDVDNITAPEAALANTTNAALGDALVGVKRTDVTGSVATTQHEYNRGFPVIAGPLFGLVEGASITAGQRTANGTAINNAITGGKSIKSKVWLPAGIIEYDGTLNGANGCIVEGMGNQGEEAGITFNGTTLKYFGSTLAVSLVGTSTSVGTRTMTSWRNLVIDGSGAADTAEGVQVGWAMRAMALLDRVTIANFGNYGLHFVDQLWNVLFNCVRLDACGTKAGANKSGIYKDASIDGGTFNYVTFRDLMIEGCGSASSAAGGINMPTTTANRGLCFDALICEGNKGADEIFISNMSALQFIQPQMERDDVAGYNIAMELSGCKGAIMGGYITGTNAANNLVGIKSLNCVLNIDGLTTNTFGTAGIQNFSSIIYTGRNSVTYSNGDTAAQWFGDYSARVAAHKNGTNQVGVASGVFTKVTFGTERYDLTGAYSGSTFTPQAIGTYQIDACVTWTAALDADGLIISIYLNGAVYKSVTQPASGAGAQAVRISAQVDTATTTDTIEIYARQTSGGPQTISGATTDTWFMASLVGRTS